MYILYIIILGELGRAVEELVTVITDEEKQFRNGQITENNNGNASK